MNNPESLNINNVSETLLIPLYFRACEEKRANEGKSAILRDSFAQCVAEFGMLLLDSEYKGNASYESILKVLEEKGVSDDVYRKEFIGLVAKASRLSPKLSH